MSIASNAHHRYVERARDKRVGRSNEMGEFQGFHRAEPLFLCTCCYKSSGRSYSSRKTLFFETLQGMMRIEQW